MKNRLITMAGGLALLAVLGKFYAVPAIAQSVRAAVVKNIDEKGRVPYESDITINCPNVSHCDGSFTPVPAGKRLVIENINLNARFNHPGDTSSMGHFFLYSGEIFRVYSLPVPPVVINEFNQREYTLNQRILTYASSVNTPTVQVYTAGGVNAQYDFTAVLSGYLIDLAQ